MSSIYDDFEPAKEEYQMTLPELVQREEMADNLRDWWESQDWDDGEAPDEKFIEDRVESFYRAYDQLMEEKNEG